jgi:hypothetical protein
MEPQVLRGQVIHVNEDGWVVINRGAQDGVSDGMRFVVLGERNARQIRNLFPFGDTADKAARPVVLRADTAYELLRVILVERACCVAISDRVPPERTPQPFLGPQGELLIYTSPSVDWRYDALDLEESSDDAPADEAADAESASEGDQADEDSASEAESTSEPAAEEGDSEEESAAELAGRQQERLWDGALPLNAVQVGDEVVMARPYHPGAWEGAADEASEPAPADASARPASYDWLKL